MSFLAPLFLLGAAAIALPVIFHLIRRSSRERVPFSSLMFLQPTPPRVTRRSRIENIFLLLLRCAVICLLAFAFARPFLSRPVAPDPAGQTGEKVLVLVDSSASIRREGLWEQAKEKARAVFRNAAPADQVACLTFDHDLRSVVDFEQWTLMPVSERATLTSQRLEAIKPGWGDTRLGNAMITACEMFESVAKDEQAPKRIVLISDLQEGSRLDGLQGFEWPRGVSVTVEPVQTKRTSNAGLQLAPEREDVPDAATDPAPRVRVINSSDSRQEQFQIGWRQPGQTTFQGPTIDAYIPPGQNRVLPVARPAMEPPPDRLFLSGDDDDFDNSVYFIPLKAEEAQILFFGNDSATNATQSLYYLKRAFQETRSLATEVVAHRPGTPLPDAQLTTARLLVLTDALPEEQIRGLKRSIENGKTLLVSVNSVAILPTLAAILGEPELAGEEVGGARYAMLAQIDFGHPLFAPFSDPRYSDFTKIHFWKHRRIQFDQIANARIIARFDSGDPALAEFPVGKGRVLVLTSGWHPADSQLALSSKFVPLLYAMLEQSGELRDQRTTYSIGEAVSLPEGVESVTVRKPDASEVTLARGEKFSQTDEPGVYTVTSVQPSIQFVVNLAPEESKTAPLPVEELERMGVPLERQLTITPAEAEARREHLHAAQLENRQKIWRWLIVTALVVLVLETWLAGRVTRRAVPAAA